jgi:hypothetical protein
LEDVELVIGCRNYSIGITKVNISINPGISKDKEDWAEFMNKQQKTRIGVEQWNSVEAGAERRAGREGTALVKADPGSGPGLTFGEMRVLNLTRRSAIRRPGKVSGAILRIPG